MVDFLLNCILEILQFLLAQLRVVPIPPLVPRLHHPRCCGDTRIWCRLVRTINCNAPDGPNGDSGPEWSEWSEWSEYRYRLSSERRTGQRQSWRNKPTRINRIRHAISAVPIQIRVPAVISERVLADPAHCLPRCTSGSGCFANPFRQGPSAGRCSQRGRWRWEADSGSPTTPRCRRRRRRYG